MYQTTSRKPPPIHRAGMAVQRSPQVAAKTPFWVEMLVESGEDGSLTAMRCTLEPGVVSHWHTHPQGQILYVLSGVGLAERHGGPAEELRAGDCITFAPDERHRHGAAPESDFTYISIQATKNGRAVTWLED